MYSFLGIEAGRLSSGQSKSKVHLYHLRLFNTTFAVFFGGRPHIGAISIGLNFNGKKQIKTLKFPSHRDDVITKRACKILNQGSPGLAVVLAGIHQDKPTRQEIKKIILNCESLTHQLTSKVKNKKVSS